MAAVASEFQKIISDARERKKNADLADRIFSRGRTQGGSSHFKSSVDGSLASRVGFKKQRGPTAVKDDGHNGRWTHDLSMSLDGPSVKGRSPNAQITSGIRKPNSAVKGRSRRKARLADALEMMETDQVDTAPALVDNGMSIRGRAGSYAVMGQNFAPGTTAADIESAMTPVGGEMISCKIIKTSPFLIAEMIFSSKENGERVIETFNNKIADGRVIKMYPKVGGYKSSNLEQIDAPANGLNRSKVAKTAPRDQVMDGSMGFPEPTNANAHNNSARAGPRLYSDKIVGGNRSSSSFQRSRGGGRQ